MAASASLRCQYSAGSHDRLRDRIPCNKKNDSRFQLNARVAPSRNFNSCKLVRHSGNASPAFPRRICLPCCVGSSAATLQENRTQPKDDEISALNKKADEVTSGLKGTSIFLVGMMGSGKTTVGKVLAKALGYYFFDSDAVVEQAAGGASVSTIFSENGEEAFRDAESVALDHLSSMVRLVVATGGGSVIRPANWGRMRNGVTVWLDVPVEALAKRVSDIGTSSRPILCNGSSYKNDYDEAYKRLSVIFEERHKFYAPADAHVSLEAIASEDAVNVCDISPYRIALQVLNEIDVLIQRRKMQDNSCMIHH